MSRVFYYSGYRMTVFHWAGEELIDKYSFEPNESGLNDFEKYLIHSPQETARILVDVIEEDYFKDTLPHVSKKDQQAILQRRVKRNYPDSVEWFYSRVIGRDTEGRKDDKIIYSVQTNPKILKPWLDIIKQQKISVSGIWSLSLLGEKLIKIMSIEHKNCLLLSQQVPSNLRQSFFKNGRLQTSRSAIVNLDDMSLAEHIEKELSQTSSYLANQRHIGFDEVMMVHVICPQEDIKTLNKNLEDSALRKYHYHCLEDVLNLFSGVDNKEQYCHGLFARLCQSQKNPIGQYGAADIFIYFYKKIISKTLIVSSIVVSLCVVFLLIFIQSEVIQFNKDIAVNNKYTRKIEINYKNQFSKIQSALNKTTAIQSALLFNKKLDESKHFFPENAMRYISNVIKKTNLNDIKITAIEWSKGKENSFVNVKKKKKKNKKINYSPIGGYIQKINIKGYLGSADDTVDVLAEKVRKFKKTLESDKKIISLKLIRIPLDDRPDKSIKKISGTEVGAANGMTLNQFEIELKVGL